MHLREQEAARVRREKRAAVRSGVYVPRSAARSFAATSTPMVDVEAASRSRRSNAAPSSSVAEPIALDGRICIPQKQLYAALSTGLPDNARSVTPQADAARADTNLFCKPMRQSENEIGVVTPEQRQAPAETGCEISPMSRTCEAVESQFHTPKSSPSKRDSMCPIGNHTQPTIVTVDAPARRPAQRRRSSHRSSCDKSRKLSSPSLDPAPSQYRPGDAAKRRSAMEPTVVKRSNVELRARPASSALAEVGTRISRFLEDESRRDSSIPELDECAEPKQRPKLAPHDRPNWCQESQADLSHTVKLLSLKDILKESRVERLRPKRSGLDFTRIVPGVESHQQTEQLPAAEGDHLIADAVNIIRQQEKRRRRRSVMGFWKRS